MTKQEYDKWLEREFVALEKVIFGNKPATKKRKETILKNISDC